MCQHMDGSCKPSLWKTYFDGQNLCNNLAFFRISLEFGFFDTRLIFHLSVDLLLTLKFAKLKLLLIV